MNITSTLRREGLLNLPSTTNASKKLVESLLAKDAHEHHCYFTSSGFHNHLNHHLLAAYDLGAPASLLQKIYDEEAKILRPLFLEEKDKEIVITEGNWTEYLGDQHAYAGYFKFFSTAITELGVPETLERYIFSPEANNNDANMLIRLVSGAVHPFINIGYGLEFGSDIVVATSVAQAAIHPSTAAVIYDFKETAGLKNDVVDGVRSPSRGLSLLEILRQVYDSDILTPIMPYDPNALLSARIRDAISGGRDEEIRRICSQFVVDTSRGEEEFEAKAEELIWTATLLLFSTSRPGRKPRLDFFLMHLVTSSLFFPLYFKVLRNPAHKAMLLRAYVPGLILYVLARGRPRINPELLMSYTVSPRPPVTSLLAPGEGAIGDPREDTDYNPWPAMLQSVIYAHDSHLIKTMRTLVYAARKYGDTPAGGVIGTYSTKGGRETHKGLKNLDGTIFVRAAGMMMENMGWSGHGQAGAEWDHSALGWNDAWKNGD